MSEDFENQLRRALRPVNPPDGFAERVLAALPERSPRIATVTVLRPASRAPWWRRLTAPAALAASLTLAIILGQHMGMQRAQREQQAGLEASREHMQALRVTSKKLDIAYQAVNRPAPEPRTPAPASGENRS